MPWNESTRRQYRRPTIRYESDLTDEEWSLLEPLLPGPASTGRPRSTDLREVLNAIQYLASAGCQWRALPTDFPPFTTVQNYFCACCQYRCKFPRSAEVFFPTFVFW